MTHCLETGESFQYQVRQEKKSKGTYVTDPDGNEFFVTDMGGVFWLNSPFDEHPAISGDYAKYLRSIAETAVETLVERSQ